MSIFKIITKLLFNVSMAELVTRLNELVEPEALIEFINARRLLPMGETNRML